VGVVDAVDVAGQAPRGQHVGGHRFGRAVVDDDDLVGVP
jgi:hypothetical protein